MIEHEFFAQLGEPPEDFDIPINKNMIIDNAKAPDIAPYETKRKVKIMDKKEKMKAIAKWITDTYEKSFKEALTTRPNVDSTEKTLHIYWQNGKSYITKKKIIKVVPKLMIYIDNFLKRENTAQKINDEPAKEFIKEEPREEKCGVLINDTVQIFSSENLAACFMAGYNSAGGNDAKIVRIKNHSPQDARLSA